jgi:hypothetical protein
MPHDKESGVLDATLVSQVAKGTSIVFGVVLALAGFSTVPVGWTIRCVFLALTAGVLTRNRSYAAAHITSAYFVLVSTLMFRVITIKSDGNLTLALAGFVVAVTVAGIVLVVGARFGRRASIHSDHHLKLTFVLRAVTLGILLIPLIAWGLWITMEVRERAQTYNLGFLGVLVYIPYLTSDVLKLRTLLYVTGLTLVCVPLSRTVALRVEARDTTAGSSQPAR